ncbi:LytR/AlgR family response regulator transcription factor [Sinosporangium siamense]|nr:LytTR family DNA-binding domain-containing protein [Sinosporangium siamense]
MLRVLAVDDETPALDELASLLRRDNRVGKVTTASDGVSALQDLVQMIGAGERLDGVFLDIRMPGLDGLDLARLIGNFPYPPKLVFVSAHDDCALQAFELRAVDYLLKPVRPARLEEAVSRLTADGPAQPAEPGPEDVIPVELGGRTRFVPRQAVWFAEAKGDYVRLHTADDRYLVRMPLAALERRWGPPGFIRVHRSALVAVRHVNEMKLHGGKITLRVGTEWLAVSRRHTKHVRELLVRQQFKPPASGDHRT